MERMPRSNIFSAIFLLAAAIYAILAFEVIEVPGVDQRKLMIIAQNVSLLPVGLIFLQSKSSDAGLHRCRSGQ
jgi:hypothetical protein